MSYIDPYVPDDPYYECWECHHRVIGKEYSAVCPKCGGNMMNINKAQE